jgi:nucleoside 2-deoxyribosyltransferase
MNVFLAASYSSQVDYQTGQVRPDYKKELEETIEIIESTGHKVFCALKADKYKINSADPGGAFKLDIEQIKKADILVALLSDKTSAGVQTEIGIALGLNKKIFMAHKNADTLAWFNQAIIRAGKAEEILLPIQSTDFATS